MKKLSNILLAALVLVAAASCNKETNQEIPETNGKVTVLTAYADNGIVSKTTLDGVNVVWSASDVITAFDAAGKCYNSTETQILENGSIAKFSVPTEEPLFAVYPAYEEGAEVEMANGKITATIPTRQNAINNTFDNGANVEVAKITDKDNIKFKNVGGLVAVKVKGTTHNIISIKIADAAGAFKMTGTVTAGFDTDGNVVVDDIAEGESFVDLTGDITAGETYYAVIAPGIYEGVTITFTDEDGNTATYTKKTDLEVERNSNQLIGGFDIPEIKWVEGAAPSGTVLFSEPFTGFDADSTPTAPGSYAEVYNNATVGYVCKDGTAGTATKIYKEDTAGGESPELLVSKSGGEFTISGIPTGNNTCLTVVWNSNNTNIKLLYGEEQISATEVGAKSYQAVLTVPSGTTSFNLTFKNTNSSSNGRLDNISVIAGEPEAPEQVATPTFSVAGGTYTSAQSVEISCETSDATIHYTLDGSDPTVQSATYTEAITISETKTLKAIAVKDGMTASEIASATYTINVNYMWVETALSSITSNDVFVIVGNNGANYAMSNDKGTSDAPTAVSVTVSGANLIGTIADNIKWNLSGDATNGYTFYPNGSTKTWLYCTSTNNGVRVGTNENKAFTIDSGYLKHSGTSRYVGIYNSQDWRCYTSNGGNIAGQTFKFYKRTVSDGKVDAGISYNPASATITYGESLTQPTLNNDHGLTVTYQSSAVAVATVATDGTISVVKAGSATITASWAEQTINGVTYRAGNTTFALTVNKVEVTIAFNNPTTTVAVGSTVTNAATISPSGLTITYSSGNESAATVNASGVVTGVANGVAVITASFAGNDNYTSASDSYQIIVGDSNDGSLEHPFTVTDVLSLTSASGVYVTGTIKSITEVSTEHGNATYIITDGTSDVTVFRGKFVGNTDFTSSDQISVNDNVIVYGNINQYQNVSQLAAGNYIYSLNGISKVLTAGSLETSVNNANKQITVTWGAATGTTSAISYVVTCDNQSYNATAAGSHTFTMGEYGTYEISVVASAPDAISATAITSATLTSSSTTTKEYTLTLTAADIDALDTSVTGYGRYNGSHSKDAIAADNSTFEVVFTTNQVMPNSNNIQFQASKGTLYNTVDLGSIKSVSAGNDALTVIIGSSQNPTTTVSGGGYFVIKKTNSGAASTASITITFER